MMEKSSKHMTFGERLAYTRNKKGLSQRQLAKLIGFDKSEISRIETNKRNPDVPLIRRIIKALGVSEDWFENDDNFSMENLTEIKLTPKQQQLVAENEKVIGVVYKKVVCKYNPTVSYDEIFGDAAIGLCKAAKIYDNNKNNTASFFTFAYQVVTWAVFDYNDKRDTYYRFNTSLNKKIFDQELGELIAAPDEWESLEYKILVESVYQKVESILTAKEKEVFRPWLEGKEPKEAAREMGVSAKTVALRRMRIKKKCRDRFTADELFA